MEIKKKILNALSDFSGETLYENSLQLFKILGYPTERQSRLKTPTFEEFFSSFLEENSNIPDLEKFKKRALTDDWKTIELLFQLTESEMSHQGTPFDTSPVDDTIIEAYLFFLIELKDPEYTRTKLSSITRQLNRVFPMPVMILFKYGEQLTFSVIKRRLHKKDENRDVLEKVTLIQDIKFKTPHRAHIEILFDLSFEELKKKYRITNFVTLHNAWQKTLDCSELNKKFYKELSYWYFWATQNVEFPKDVEKDEAIRNATAIIRLLTRLIFIWFIKEKGVIPQALFDEQQLKQILTFEDKNQSNFYKTVLQNLFFATLNTEKENRKFRDKRVYHGKNIDFGNQYVYRYEKFVKDVEGWKKLFADIPFINGGLFENLDNKEKNLMIDGFSEEARNNLSVPDFLFFSQEREVDLNEIFGTQNIRYQVKGIIPLLEHYKFTIAENTPIEEEIALDPELLGKVFENLLASYNPETQTTARKQTGSFYTPREIVDYMTDESLKASLSTLVSSKLKQTTEEDIKTGLDILLAYSEKEHAFTEEEVSKVIEAVSELKIIDPACGSGAFPMGVLHKLVYILNKVDSENKVWRELQKQKAIKDTEAAYNMGNPEERHQRLQEIEAAFDRNTSDYGRKLFLIENSIYGVDIQPIAVQISKLRFFISLIVEQTMDPTQNNSGILPLPNLETKFVAADTLIGVEKPAQGTLTDASQGFLFEHSDEIQKLENTIQEIRHKHFNAKTPKTKKKYREADERTRLQMAETLKKNNWPSETAEMLANWDPYDQNRFAPFFDMAWMFGIKEGFDVVIGNPPYVQIQKFSGQQIQKDWEHQNYKTYAKTGDVYSLFYEQGNRLLKTNGVLTFITSNKWMRANYGKETRKFFLNDVGIQQLIDFGDSQIFENATTYTNILIFS